MEQYGMCGDECLKGELMTALEKGADIANQWKAKAERLEQQLAEVTAENTALREALEWIADASDVPGRCSGCDKPNGIPALRSRALTALAAPQEQGEQG